MGTSNFYNKNATRIYACEIEEEWDYDFLVDNLKCELQTLKDFTSEIENKWESNGLRSFPERIIGIFYREFLQGDYEYEVNLITIIRSGYYSGVNLDYDIELFANGNNFDLDDSYDMDELNELEGKDFAKVVLMKFDDLKQQMIEEIEKVYEVFSTPLIVAARFSNGETIYEKAKKTDR